MSSTASAGRRTNRSICDRNEPRYEEPFEDMARAGLLPGFIEIYIERNLGVTLKRKSLTRA
jgi:hypothetical protein